MDDFDRFSFESRSLTAFDPMDGSAASSGGYRYAVDRPNPFEQGGELSREAQNEVHKFLQQQQQNGFFRGRYDDSVVSSPGKVEDLDSPTSPYNQTNSTYSNMEDVSLSSGAGTASNR